MLRRRRGSSEVSLLRRDAFLLCSFWHATLLKLLMQRQRLVVCSEPSSTNLAHGAGIRSNNGLDIAVRLVELLKEQLPTISYSDFYQFKVMTVTSSMSLYKRTYEHTIWNLTSPMQVILPYCANCMILVNDLSF